MMFKIGDITTAIEQFAPLALQEGFDNCGLLVGDSDRHIDSALLCVDITEDVMQEARELGVGMIISHHPVIFSPLKKLTGSSYVERIVAQAIKSDIALYACHTNLDSVHGGMSHRLAQMLSLDNVQLLGEAKACDPSAGFGVVGELDREWVTEDFLVKLKDIFGTGAVRYSDICRPHVRRVAICSGSGASLIESACRAKADIYICADLKYNNFIDADGRIVLADIGHYESEYCVIELLCDVIRKKLHTFALHKSAKSKNPVNYI